MPSMGPKSKSEEAKAKSNQSGDVKLNLKTLEDLKFDIDLNFQDVLDRDLDFKGSFAFRQTYQDFPNPYLRVGALGHIGLPVSTREAKAIISECSQAPFGKGAETIVDKEVRNTWQLDAQQVAFGNPKWKDFINGLLRTACEKLGVDYDISQPSCELYKLLVYEPGSHFKPHQDTEKSPGMFATMVLLLPSEFTGGDVHLQHADSSEVFQCSTGSLFNICALGWYTDIFHEIKPIETGYRLALSYNLIHKSKISKPVLPADDVATKKLEQVLLAWAGGKVKSVPAKLLYLLNHQYSASGLKSTGLKGADSKKVALMLNIGTPLGFKFALANVQYYVYGCPEDYRDPEDIKVVDPSKEWMKFEKPVDLEGQPIADLQIHDIESTWGFSDEDMIQFIPEDLPAKIREGDESDYKKDPYTGNDGGDAQVWYHRTVLIIWHEKPSADAGSSSSRKRTHSDNSDATDSDDDNITANKHQKGN